MRQGVGRPSPPCLVFLQYLAQVRSITAGIRRVASPIALDIQILWTGAAPGIKIDGTQIFTER